MSSIPLEERFWSKVAVRGEDECWEWMACKDWDGYGMIRGNGSRHRSNRLAWTLTRGEIPPGMLVCHRCDNPPCCNPRHLFLDTIAGNAADMVQKGRSTRGEKNTKALLGPDQILEIRRIYAAGGLKQSEIAERFGIKQITVSNIVTRKTWGHLPAECGERPPRPRRRDFGRAGAQKRWERERQRRMEEFGG